MHQRGKITGFPSAQLSNTIVPKSEITTSQAISFSVVGVLVPRFLGWSDTSL